MAFITSENELQAVLDHDGLAWVIKHSNRCGISDAALAEFEKYTGEHTDEQAHVLIIQEHRDLSNLLAEKLGRVHQSPQLFLLKSGEVVWTATHWSITAAAMAEAVASSA